MRKILAVIVLLLCFSICACQLNMEPMYPNHEHTIASEFSYNENIHWKACSECDEKLNKSEHDYGAWIRLSNEGLDEYRICKTCEYREERVHEHNLSNIIEYDENGHWVICKICDDHVNEEAHSYTSWSIITPATPETPGVKEGTCSCGYKTQENFTYTE